jgi:hypothetical protein
MVGPHTRGRGGGFGLSASVCFVARRVCASEVQNAPCCILVSPKLIKRLCFARMHMGLFCIENVPILILIDFCSVATRPTLVAIDSHWVATRSGRVTIVLNPSESCNGSKLLQLVSSSCN